MRDAPNPDPQSACKRAGKSRRVGVMSFYRPRALAEHRERNRGSAKAISHAKQGWEWGGRTSETSAVFSFRQRSHIQVSIEPGSTIPHAPKHAGYVSTRAEDFARICSVKAHQNGRASGILCT